MARRRFRRAAEVLGVLVAELRRERRPDCIVFSGDASMLGFASEAQRAAAVLAVGQDLPGVAVPGNHDYYTRSAEASGAFEKVFAPWQEGERLTDGFYPFARRVGPLWLIGVNAATGNRWPWDATGRVGADQLDRLARLLDSLAPGLRILVTHYPIGDAHGRPEKPWHCLRNLGDLVGAAQRGGVCLWLHGHRHEGYHSDDPRLAPFPVICAGSATEEDLWGYNEYAIQGRQLQAVRRCFDPEQRCFRQVKTFELELRSVQTKAR
jgi:3',5'-cyclic AMP phosphodiesterase CpdA